ncbi:MAG: hypothetical protein JO101_12165 [Candidatus Eremiobacteraeota bacterium]|nr:hypothetical protein [Candidatus Eremiobacteraeota bacterium]
MMVTQEVFVMLEKASRFGVLGFVAVLLVALTGCNNGSNNVTVAACSLPSGVQAALVYPVPNSTHNSTNLPQIYIALSGPVPSTADVELVFPGGGFYLGGSLTPVSYSQIPTPNQTPSLSNPTYYSSSFNNVLQPIPSGTTISAGYNYTDSACSPPVFLANFST